MVAILWTNVEIGGAEPTMFSNSIRTIRRGDIGSEPALFMVRWTIRAIGMCYMWPLCLSRLTRTELHWWQSGGAYVHVSAWDTPVDRSKRNRE